ncbi:MAG: response regulator transcription factor [Thermoanaerobaculia bacterium]
MKRSTILVVDDDELIRSAVADQLSAHDYDVIEAADGNQALARCIEAKPDLILTDLAMPHADGFTLIRRVRETSAVPIIVLSIRGVDSDKVRALDLGADDFVVKPFSTPELLARIRAQLRRGPASTLPTSFEFPGLTVDLDRRKVVQGDRDIRLTPTEFAILELLTRNAGRPVTFDDLIATVWRGAPGTTNDAVRFHVSSLRRKIEPNPAKPKYILTEPWIGYRFIVEPVSG